MQTLFLQLGCSGLFAALELAKCILSEVPAFGKNVLITADNNMMKAHQRCERSATTNNINEWLWSAIFGEGVGCRIVGNHKVKDTSNERRNLYFTVDSNKR